MNPQAPEPEGSDSSTAQPEPELAPPRLLSLGDPLDGRAAEDRPESWGERGESESDRLAHYRTRDPPAPRELILGRTVRVAPSDDTGAPWCTSAVAVGGC